MVSKAREDLPQPERPVITTSSPRGMSSEIFFRLWVRAPLIEILSIYLQNFYTADFFRVKLNEL